MEDTVAVGGFMFLTLALMFGGRRRRSFVEASHKAAGFIVAIFCLTAIAVFIMGSISHFLGLAQTNSLSSVWNR